MVAEGRQCVNRVTFLLAHMWERVGVLTLVSYLAYTQKMRLPC